MKCGSVGIPQCPDVGQQPTWCPDVRSLKAWKTGCETFTKSLWKSRRKRTLRWCLNDTPVLIWGSLNVTFIYFYYKWQKTETRLSYTIKGVCWFTDNWKSRGTYLGWVLNQQLKRCHGGPGFSPPGPAPFGAGFIFSLHKVAPKAGLIPPQQQKTVTEAPKFPSSLHTIQSKRNGLFSRNYRKRKMAYFPQKPQKISSGLLALTGLVPISKPIQVTWRHR